jgi:hypothetical protein
MKNNKSKIIFLAFLISIFLTGCTDNTRENSTTSSEGINQDSNAEVAKEKKGGNDDINFPLMKISSYAGYTEEMGGIRLRKNADASFQDQEAHGFLFRDNNKEADFENIISNIKTMMTSYGYLIEETKPKNTSSDVVTFLKLEKGSVKCIVEYRKITSKEIPELAVGCWE